MGHHCLQLLEQTACGPQSSSPVLTPRSCTKRGIPGPVSPPAHSRSDLPVPPDPVQLERGAWTLLAPLIPQVQGPSCVLWGSYSPYPRPGPSQARWAGFIARSARLLVLRWVSCRICPIIWTVEFNSHCVLTRSPANRGATPPPLELPAPQPHGPFVQ